MTLYDQFCKTNLIDQEQKRQALLLYNCQQALLVALQHGIAVEIRSVIHFERPFNLARMLTYCDWLHYCRLMTGSGRYRLIISLPQLESSPSVERMVRLSSRAQA